MKTITIKAWQVEQGYKVHYFSNTCQVSIGTVMTREQWETAVSHPRANMICTGLEPSQTEDDENLLLDDAPVKTIAHETEFDNESGQTYVDAREFDAVALELSAMHAWSSESVLADAMLPDAGENNLGTVGVKGNIARGKALSIVRKNAARETGLDVSEISRVAYRAQSLPVIKQFAKLLTVQPF